ncbi:MAG TPA: Gfo/Idh/MocA family oxidoreductase, partial [Candidatus Acidoferrum sp.]|nr:Gfo/Idh/MocA family oxidoreductase [Candidatus Acidoferrum sp.]
MTTAKTIRVGLIGSGAAAGQHVRALAALDGVRIVGVAGRTRDKAAALLATGGAVASTATIYADAAAMLDTERPDVVFVAVPPHLAGDACRLVIERGLPFLVEKPLAADAQTPLELAAEIRRRDLIVAVGYQWRGIDFLPEVRRRLAGRPPRLVVARWMGDTPPPEWWRHVADGGGQIVEQATHLYDVARLLLGEARVVAARIARHKRPAYPDANVADVGAALLEFESGAIGSFANTCLLASSLVEIEFASEGLRTSIRLGGDWPYVTWTVRLE